MSGFHLAIVPPFSGELLLGVEHAALAGIIRDITLGDLGRGFIGCGDAVDATAFIDLRSTLVLPD